MDQLPPPPARPDEPFGYPAAPGGQAPAPVAASRPGTVTAAGWALIVIGVLTAAAGLFVSSFGIEQSVVAIVTIFVLAIGAAGILAGILVLRLSPTGRVLGFVVAGLGLASGLLQFDSSSVLTLAVNGFIFWALATNGEAFRVRG